MILGSEGAEVHTGSDYLCAFGHASYPLERVIAARDGTRQALAEPTWTGDHRSVRRTSDDAMSDRDPKPVRQKAPEERSPDPGELASVVEALQRNAGNAAVGALFASRRDRSAAQAGESLAPAVQAAAQRKLGTDLGDVRVHSDAAADSYARSMHAQAVTQGKDVFVTSRVDPATSGGRKTLLHELVHVAQSSNAMPAQRQPSTEAPAQQSASEAEARAISASGFGGVTVRPAEGATAGVAHLKPDSDEDEDVSAGEAAKPGSLAQELLNPPDSTEPSEPNAGSLGANENVAFEITIVEPLRAVQVAVEEQDWEKAYDILQTIGQRMLDYQLAYEKSNPALSQALMSARGWLGVFYQQLNRRLDRGVWSDDQMSSYVKDEIVGEFERIETLFR